MINFKDTPKRDSGIIYNSTFTQILKLYNTDPVKAGELAISAIELVLSGEISSDDMMIDIILEPMKVVGDRNKAKYDDKVEHKRQKKMQDMRLKEIADLHLQGYKQSKIGEKLGLSQQTVSNRMGIIKAEFPELLQGKMFVQDCTNFVQNGTTNVQDEMFVQNCTNEEMFVQGVLSENVCTDKENHLKSAVSQKNKFVQVVQTHDNDNVNDNVNYGNDGTKEQELPQFRF